MATNNYQKAIEYPEVAQSFYDRCVLACERNSKFTFNVWEKNANIGKQKSYAIIPSEFENNPVLVLDEVQRIRAQVKVNNRKQIIENYNKPDNIISPDKVINNIISPCVNNKINMTLDSNINIYTDGLPTTLFIAGSGKAGKSRLLMHIWNKNYANLDWITFLFTFSSQNKIYEKDKKLLIRNEFNAKDSAMIESMKYINQHTDNKYNFLCMFDDCIDIKYSPVVNKLVCVYRNSGLSTIISSQYVKMLSKQNRANINSIAFFRFNEDEVIEQVIKMYLKSYFIQILGRDRNMIDMVKYYKDMTMDHGFFYLVPCEQTLTYHRLKL
jgi:hypothetical protein